MLCGGLLSSSLLLALSRSARCLSSSSFFRLWSASRRFVSSSRCLFSASFLARLSSSSLRRFSFSSISARSACSRARARAGSSVLDVSLTDVTREERPAAGIGGALTATESEPPFAPHQLCVRGAVLAPMATLGEGSKGGRGGDLLGMRDWKASAGATVFVERRTSGASNGLRGNSDALWGSIGRCRGGERVRSLGKDRGACGGPGRGGLRVRRASILRGGLPVVRDRASRK